ncbi:MAG: type II secretion system F family protein [Planctomycetota bacterium]
MRAEFYDAVATMLDAGLPLTEALSTLAESADDGRRKTQRAVVRSLTHAATEGEALHEAMSAAPGWFGPSEVAIVEAGQHRGELAAALRVLGERQARSNELAGKLAGVLAYPALVSLVGLGVVIFLSRGPLPRLVEVLTDAGIDPPALTRAVIAIGSGLAIWWPIVLVVLALAGVTPIMIARGMASAGRNWPPMVRKLVPGALRAGALARVAGELAAMGRCGVPLVEALRACAATCGGPITASLGRSLDNAAKDVERGETVARSIDDRLWFNAEFRRLVATAEASGELEDMLERLADRESRRASRLIDRLSALAEPGVILVLAAVVGIVVMAAALPLVRLREVLG